LAQHVGHGHHPDAVAERRHVEYVVVVLPLGHHVDHRVVYCALVHGGLRRCAVYILLKVGRQFVEPVHIYNLLLYRGHVFVYPLVGVDLEDVEVLGYLDLALAEDIPLEHVAEGRLGVRAEHQHPFALGEEERRRGAQRGLAQPSLPRVDQNPQPRPPLEQPLEAYHDILSVTSLSLSIYIFQFWMLGYIYGRSLRE